MHFLLDGLEVALGDGFHGKIVVEASVDGGSNRGQGPRVELHDRLGQQVRCGVAQDVHAFVGMSEDALNRAIDVQRR